MSEPFLAEIRVFGFNYAPRNWAQCDGQILPINQNQSLYSLLGTTYGGDGRTSFALPDLRGRTPIHTGRSNGGANHTLGSKSGEEDHTLRGAMALGPTSREEAFRIWAELSSRQETLQDFLRAVDRAVQPEEIPLSHLILNLQYDLYHSDELIARVARTGEAVLVQDAASHPEISREFHARFQSRETALVPMVAKGRCAGVLMADNHYNRRPITQQDLDLLQMFAQQAALAIFNANTFERLRDTITELNSTRQQLVQNERLAAIGKTAAFVAHEIRNPLVTIGGFARSLKKHPDARERVIEGAGIIVQEIERLEGMLKGVMDFARPSTPVFTVEDVNTLVKVSSQRVSVAVAGKRVEI